MLGHGSPFGLLNFGQFPGAGSHIIDESMALPLKCKTSSIFIWCYSDQFIQRHGLKGMSCGMFISEVREAEYYGFWRSGRHLTDQLRDSFNDGLN
jgi:hypothetical protein